MRLTTVSMDSRGRPLLALRVELGCAPESRERADIYGFYIIYYIYNPLFEVWTQCHALDNATVDHKLTIREFTNTP